jgi:hypothetical protein
MISNQARDFWILLKTYPKQIEMPLSEAREADTHAEDFTSEPAGVNLRQLLRSTVSGRKFQEQVGRFSISLAEDLCLALPTRGERRQAISPLRARRACSSRTIVSHPSTPFQRRLMIRCELINGCSIMAANHRG